MSWLICNVCIRRPANGVKSFNITSCFHVLCDSCVTPDDTVCPLCRQKCAVIELNNRTPEGVRSLFNDVTVDRINVLKRALDVQHMQRTSVLSYCRDLHKKYQPLKDRLITTERNANILWHKYQDCKKTNELLTRKLLAYEEQLIKYQNTLSDQTQQMINYSSMYGPNMLPTPRRVSMNLNSSVFVTPESVVSKTSSRSSSSRNGSATPFCRSYKIADISSYSTPKPTSSTPMSTPRQFMPRSISP